MKELQREFVFLIKDNSNNKPNDLDMLVENESEITWLESGTTFWDVLVIAGIYPSKSRARKDGWDKDLPSGFYDAEIGKKRIRITIWNPTE